MDQVTAAVQPFIPDHGQQFAHHLLDFLASKLSIAGYDRLMFGEAASPSHALLPSSPGPLLRSEDESHGCATSSTSSQSSRGAGSATDSDAYVEMLQHCAGQGPLRQSSGAMPEDATSGADHFAAPGDQGTARTASAHMSPSHHRMKRRPRGSGGNHRVKLKCRSRNS